jgi:integrase
MHQMPGRKLFTPTYRHHKARDCAVVTIGGTDHYLGAYDSPESREKYDRLVAEWLARGRQPEPPPTVPEGPVATGLTVNDLILRFVSHATTYYRRPDGTPTTEVTEYKRTLGVMRELYGRTSAAAFGPLALKAVREKLIASDLSRGVINQRIDRIKRVYKWAVENELVPATVHQALLTVRGLPKGRSAARESEPVKPVPEGDVQKTLPHLNRFLAAMVRVQLLTGMRPGEVCQMRGVDVETAGTVWMYRPPAHKTSHHGHTRVILLGPKTQDVLRPLLAEAGHGYVFDSRRACAEARATRAGSSAGMRPKKDRARKNAKRPMLYYKPSTYANAVRRACEKASVPSWHPHQLRHNAATAIRREFGLDMARAVLGHHSPQITELYAELDLDRAADVMAKIG